MNRRFLARATEGCLYDFFSDMLWELRVGFIYESLMLSVFVALSSEYRIIISFCIDFFSGILILSEITSFRFRSRKRNVTANVCKPVWIMCTITRSGAIIGCICDCCQSRFQRKS